MPFKIGNQTLSGNDLDIMKRAHNLMILKEKVMDETEWFENINYPKPPHVSDILHSKLIAFKAILMNGVDNKCLDKQNSTLLVSYLCLLTSKNWLNLKIINVFIKLINNSSTPGQVISLSEIQHSTHERLKQKSKEWKSNTIEYCVIILNVIRLKNGTTPVATVDNQGNHCSCLKVDFANKTWIYADSLGWLLPKNIRLSPEPFLKVLMEVWGDNLHTDIGTTVCVKLAHDHTASPDNHCSSHCLRNMPFQGDNFNVCGLAVIISATTLTSYFNARPIEETMWLSKTDIYSEYSRKMLMVFGRKNIYQLAYQERHCGMLITF